MSWTQDLEDKWIIETSFYRELQEKRLVGIIGMNEVAYALLADNICCVSSFIKDGASFLQSQKDKWKRLHKTGMSPEQVEDMINAHNLVHPKYYAILEQLPLELYVKYLNSDQIIFFQRKAQSKSEMAEEDLYTRVSSKRTRLAPDVLRCLLTQLKAV